LEAALRVDPNLPAAHYTFAKCDIANEDYVGALTHLEALVRVAPEDPEVHYLLGMCFVKLGRTSDAIEQYQDVLRLAPEDNRARATLKALIGRMRVK
jgi:Flp pilus assembly protein TadD